MRKLDPTFVVECIAAIREDRLVGKGTCSVIDECWEDSSLWEEIEREKPRTVAASVEMARDIHEKWLEQGLNQRWGDDDDEQLVTWKEWKAERKKK